jgi:hypothetical protein
MKIKLICDIPVSRRHNLKAGMIKETVKSPVEKVKLGGVWVEGYKGERVRILDHEYRVIK